MRRWLFVLVLLVLAVPAHAHAHSRHHHVHHHSHRGKLIVAPDFAVGLGKGLEHMLDSIGPRPHAWCGWEMRREMNEPDPQYNLARNWAHWGRPAMGPAVGVVVVWSHHVGRIVGGQSGEWVVRSGNDSHAVRERVRSVAGAIAFRWPST